jgi:hypothetical protein
MPFHGHRVAAIYQDCVPGRPSYAQDQPCSAAQSGLSAPRRRCRPGDAGAVAADLAGITERRKESAARRQATDLDTCYPTRLTVIGDGRRASREIVACQIGPDLCGLAGEGRRFSCAQIGGSARGYQELFASLAAWPSKLRAWREAGQAAYLCIVVMFGERAVMHDVSTCVWKS